MIIDQLKALKQVNADWGLVITEVPAFSIFSLAFVVEELVAGEGQISCPKAFADEAP